MDDTQRECKIYSQIKLIEECIARAQELQNQLRDRLTPIIEGNEDIPPQEEYNKAPSFSIPLAQTLNNYQRILFELYKSQEDLLNRLDL